ENQLLMAFSVVQVREPTHIPEAPPLLPHIVYPEPRCALRVMIRNSETHIPAIGAQPHLLILEKWEDFFQGDRVLVPKNDELLAILDKLCDVLPEKRERRIRDHDVCLFQEFDGLCAAEISVALQ